MEVYNKMLEIRQNETKREIMNMLRNKSKCALVRSMGFGKTVIMSQIAQTYDRVLYIYPSEAVKEAAKKNINNKEITFWTYNKLGRFYKNIQLMCETILGKYDLIIFDELHHMGAKNTGYVISKLLGVLDTRKTHVLGGTATPKRMDGFDVIDSFFDNCIVSFYGLDNMIDDGLIPELYYVYALEGYKIIFDDVRKLYERAYKNKQIDGTKKEKLIVNLRKKENQIAYMMNAPSIIKKAIDEVYSGVVPQYMKFLIFFSTKDILRRKSEEVKKWFEAIYPDYNINTLSIFSEAIEKKNVLKLDSLVEKPNTIDLIFSINMLNEGYHVENVTACILLRPTQSQTVYTQQIGRSMQVGMENRPIIVDFVENLDTKALFNVDVTPLKLNKADDDISKQLNNISFISPKNIHIVDRVADIKKVVKKLNSELDDDLEKDILDYRIISSMQVGTMANILHISPWQIIQVLTKNSELLKKHNLEFKPEIDRYMYNTESNSKVDFPDFDKYIKMLERMN